MTTLILIWLIAAVILEYVLAVDHVDVHGWKKLAYYVVLAPYLGLIAVRTYLGKTGWFAAATEWLKK